MPLVTTHLGQGADVVASRIKSGPTDEAEISDREDVRVKSRRFLSVHTRTLALVACADTRGSPPKADRISGSCHILVGSLGSILAISSGCSSMHRTTRPFFLAVLAVVIALIEKWMNSLPLAARRWAPALAWGMPQGWCLFLHGLSPSPFA